VAAVLRDRVPGLTTKKLHKLLYYCQGHHLGTFGVPLFTERISAWDMGPVVGELWTEERGTGRPGGVAELDEAELNTIGYVLSRYGALTGRDLEKLTHSEPPWQLADTSREPHTSARIEIEWIRDYFAGDGSGSDLDEDDDVLDSAEVAAFLSNASERRKKPAVPDDPVVILERIHELRARIQERG
jgi:uncharacterized phage-associated protein